MGTERKWCYSWAIHCKSLQETIECSLPKLDHGKLQDRLTVD
jgi:hypothetical protein